MGKIIVQEEGSKPPAPSTGQSELYPKTDDNWYVQNSAGVEVQLSTSGDTVNSVALLDASITPIYTISGSPVTSSGTLTFTLSNQSANKVFAGPVSGGSAQPTFRSLVSADLPTITLTGDATGSGSAGSISTTISSTTVNGKLLTGYTVGANTPISATDSILTAFGKVQGQINNTDLTAITALTGDGTATGPGSSVFTLATVNGNVGTFGSSTSIPSITVNGKGLITSVTGNVVIAPAGTLTGTTLASNVVNSSLTSVGIISSGTWNGTTIAIANGGTGQTSATTAFNALSPLTTAGDILYYNGSNNVRLPIGTSGQLLTVSAGEPAWITTASIPTVVVTKTANYPILSTDNKTYFNCDTSGGAFTLTLPAPTSGFNIRLVDSTGYFSTNNLTLAPNASEKIEGLAASKVFQTAWGGWTIFSDGTNWFVF